MKTFLQELKRSLLATLVLAVLLCGLYPFAIWVVAQTAFPDQADGSLVVRDGKLVGSRLIGQNFSAPVYFHARPSAAGKGYDAAASGGSNLGPLSQKLLDGVKQRVDDYRRTNGLSAETLVPGDAVTASGSGLDPHISVANAALQMARIARERSVPAAKVEALVEAHTEGRDLGILGEPRVNVLLLNLALDRGGG